MKAQNTIKLAKKTVFVYKNVKNQNNFSTNTGDMGHTIISNATIGIL
ncbi:hypothetical protein [Pedobacter rhizosphaerae]|uniref:Uncharacterized protein n=1 Tax=Pedobacter rhizosphaerae TaxID=390241 RepID=A0A1H9LBF7_9SPHI|nr:hypothetical protein [Pedobacter rhizosphaerae]SER08559.1 hypothetical protein SAMN04488023_10469 [Pedobacter rhizosphaerae]